MKFFIMDVFGRQRYSGNQLAVFFDDGGVDGEEMQQIAREINFSESTFIDMSGKREGGYDVRIFTPGSEVDFAGHPCLGTGYIIRKYIESGEPDRVQLNLKAGRIEISFRSDMIWMKQIQPRFSNVMDPAMMAAVLGIDENDIETGWPVEEVSTGLPFTIVPLKSLETLKNLKLDPDNYLVFTDFSNAKGILAFSREAYEKQQDISSRVFVPHLGIPEDPATGSATGCLAAYLLKNKVFDKTSLSLKVGQGYQIGRPSELSINASLKMQSYDINVGGRVIEIADGTWHIHNG